MVCVVCLRNASVRPAIVAPRQRNAWESWTIRSMVVCNCAAPHYSFPMRFPWPICSTGCHSVRWNSTWWPWTRRIRQSHRTPLSQSNTAFSIRTTEKCRSYTAERRTRWRPWWSKRVYQIANVSKYPRRHWSLRATWPRSQCHVSLVSSTRHRWRWLWCDR